MNKSRPRIATRLSEIEYALDFKFNRELMRIIKTNFDGVWIAPYWHVHAVSERRRKAFLAFLERENFAIVVPEEEEKRPSAPNSELPWEEAK